MKLAKIALRRLLDSPTDPAARELATGVLELLEAHAPEGFYPGDPTPTPPRGYERPAPTAGTSPAPTAGTEIRREGHNRGSAGYGYRRGPDPNTFIADPDAMQALATIKSLRQSGETYRGIAEKLNAAGVPSSSGRPWNLAMVKIQCTRLWGDPELSADVANFDPLAV